MGYRDDFYTKDNIIGYTGKIGENPTVYFADAGRMNPRTVTVNGRQQVLVSFGHITQAHDRADNIGRERVRESYSYSISNVMYEGAEHAQECVYGEREADRLGLVSYPTPDGHADFHISRNRFEAVTGGTIDMLVLAIKKFPEIKPMDK